MKEPKCQCIKEINTLKKKVKVLEDFVKKMPDDLFLYITKEL